MLSLLMNYILIGAHTSRVFTGVQFVGALKFAIIARGTNKGNRIVFLSCRAWQPDLNGLSRLDTGDLAGISVKSQLMARLENLRSN